MPISLVFLIVFVGFISCSNDATDAIVINEEGTDGDETVTELHAAFAAFNTDAKTQFLDGPNMVVDTRALKNKL